MTNQCDGFTKHEAASLQILCRLLTARGNRTDEHLVTHAVQLADVWLERLEAADEEKSRAPLTFRSGK